MPLTVKIPAMELYDPEKEEFFNVKETQLTIEHSLYSISKWEAKWKKPFLSAEKNIEETLDYIRCMTINKNVDEFVYSFLPNTVIDQIQHYIDDPMTATTFGEQPKEQSKTVSKTPPKKIKNKKIITSEEIYYQMTALNIPFECDKWHLNRLITLIRICAIRNAPPKKMGKKELMSRNRSLNEARKRAMHTTG